MTVPNAPFLESVQTGRKAKTIRSENYTVYNIFFVNIKISPLPLLRWKFYINNSNNHNCELIPILSVIYNHIASKIISEPINLLIFVINNKTNLYSSDLLLSPPAPYQISARYHWQIFLSCNFQFRTLSTSDKPRLVFCWSLW